MQFSLKLLTDVRFFSQYRASSNSTNPSNEELYWYPLKVILPENKSRTLYMESGAQRQEILTQILSAQGFTNQLDQYTVENIIGEGSCNPVWLGQHRITGVKVAIKAIDTSKYQRLSRENQISEGDAMLAVQQSFHVVNFIEEF